MKNYLVLLVPALFVLGCSKSQNGEDNRPSSDFIQFNPTVTSASVVSRAAEVDAAGLQSTGIMLWGYESATAPTTVTDAFSGAFFSGGTAGTAYTYSNGEYSSASTELWPTTNFVSFIATQGGNIATYNAAVASTSAPTFTFNQTLTSAASMKDFLVAVSLGNTKSPGAVNLNFAHVLSKVSFRAYLDTSDPNFRLSIDSVALLQVHPSGTYKLSGVASTTSNTNLGAWDRSGTVQDSVFAGLATNTNIQGASGNGASITAATGALMVIPGAAYQIYVKFRITSIQGGSSSYTRAYTYTPTGNWIPGNHYSYNFRIQPSGNVVFTTAVIPWTDASEVEVPIGTP